MALVPPSPVAFLLGAGASADARIPVMREMHRAFIDRQNPGDREFAADVESIASRLPYI
jgi:hypothetical protein